MNVEALNEQVDAGVIGFKIHEDWGATPAVIDTALASARIARSSSPCTPTR